MRSMAARYTWIPQWEAARRSPLRDAHVLFEVFRRRVVARIDRIGQELLLVIGPELADVGVGLDDSVDELAALALALADENLADHVAILIELDRPARGVGERDRSEER